MCFTVLVCGFAAEAFKLFKRRTLDRKIQETGRENSIPVHTKAWVSVLNDVSQDETYEWETKIASDFSGHIQRENSSHALIYS